MHFWNPRGASTRRIARNKSLGVEIQPLTIRQAGPLVRTKAASESDPTTSLTGFVAFQPFDELQGELAGIEQSEQANGRASLARSDYAEELEAAVNAQIKCVSQWGVYKQRHLFTNPQRGAHVFVCLYSASKLFQPRHSRPAGVCSIFSRVRPGGALPRTAAHGPAGDGIGAPTCIRIRCW